MATAEQWLGKLANLKVDKARGDAAPHKPLLLLVVLHRRVWGDACQSTTRGCRGSEAANLRGRDRGKLPGSADRNGSRFLTVERFLSRRRRIPRVTAWRPQSFARASQGR